MLAVGDGGGVEGGSHEGPGVLDAGSHSLSLRVSIFLNIYVLELCQSTTRSLSRTMVTSKVISLTGQGIILFCTYLVELKQKMYSLHCIINSYTFGCIVLPFYQIVSARV